MKNMKSMIQHSLLALVLLMCASSCESWLKVTPEDRLAEDMLFADRKGFVKALNGVYIELTTTQLYGQDLTVGALDAMAQYYNASAAPSGHPFKNVASYLYTESGEKSLFQGIWEKAYKMIANCNTIVEKCEANDCPVDDPYRSMIKGEALALRALLHFDLLRLFGPLPSQLNQPAIPYQTSSELAVMPILTGQTTLNLIINDLQEAAALLKTSDPYCASADEKALYDQTDIDYRQFRLNYYAVRALLARAYLWGGEKETAYTLATGIILEAQNNGQPLFPFVTNSAATNSTQPDRVFASEVLFAVYHSSREKIYKELFSPELEDTKILTAAGNLTDGRVNEMYDDKNDYRYQAWAVYNRNGVAVVYNRKYQEENATAKFRYMIPLVRLSELYLIAAECAPTMGEASNYLNAVRNARNCFSVELSEDNRMSQIASEFKREMLGEGQLFFFYKRNEMVNIPDGAQSAGTKNIELNLYVIPLPESETSQRTSTEATNN